jgi:tricorn protease-like protein
MNSYILNGSNFSINEHWCGHSLQKYVNLLEFKVVHYFCLKIYLLAHGKQPAPVIKTNQ